MIKIKADFSGTLSYLQNLEKQTRFATAVALTRTVAKMRTELQDEARRVFKDPTPYTLRSIKYKAATKADLTALVYVEGADRIGGNVDYSPADLLGHQFFAGGRKRKRLELYLDRLKLISPGEYIAPGAGAKLDRFGNMSRGQLQQIISQLRLGLDPASYASKSARSRRNVRKAGRIFWSRGDRGLPRGAWVDQGAPIGVRPLLVIIKAPRYKRRLPFIEQGKRIAAREFPRQFRIAYQQAVASAR